MKDKELRKLLLDAGILDYRCYSGNTEFSGFFQHLMPCHKKLKGVTPPNYNNEIERLRTHVRDITTALKDALLSLTKRIEALEQKKKR